MRHKCNDCSNCNEEVSYSEYFNCFLCIDCYNVRSEDEGEYEFSEDNIEEE
jgi:hypothetical protein